MVILIAIVVATILAVIIARKVYVSMCVVQSAADAVAIAKPAMVEKYGEELVNKKGPYTAKYNRQDGTWHVYGTLPKGYVGGTPEAIVSERNGDIISIWHGK